MTATASTDIVERTTAEVFVPTTVGGGVRSVEDARKLLASGADKVAINTAAVKPPKLITDVANRFGSQAMVLSIEAKRAAGRQLGGLHRQRPRAHRPRRRRLGEEGRRAGCRRDPAHLCRSRRHAQGLRRRARQGGDRRGVDPCDRLRRARDAGTSVEVVREGGADAVAVADCIHYGRHGLPAPRGPRSRPGLPVRDVKAECRMSTQRVVVVDYGMGNVLSVCRAIEHCGGAAVLTGEPRGGRRRRTPGAARRRRVRRLHGGPDRARPRRAGRRFVATGRPFLGICVGMQILHDYGEEFGGAAGLGLIPGRVAQIPTAKADGGQRKIPHIGWTTVTPPPDAAADRWSDTLFADTAPGTPLYFVHSFSAAPSDPAHLLAIADYQGFRRHRRRPPRQHHRHAVPSREERSGGFAAAGPICGA